MVGGVLSVTVTVCWQVAELPLESVTVQVTMVVPSRKVAGALFVAGFTPQLSEVIGVPSAKPVASQLLSAKTANEAGQTMVGSKVSGMMLTIEFSSA